MTDKFLVITHVNHNSSKGIVNAYSPYVREMNLWFRNNKRNIVVAPFSDNGTISGKEPYRTKSLTLKPIPSFDLLSLRNAVIAIVKIPIITIRIFKEMKRADHIHLRCPGNIGLIACICQIFFPNKPKTAKYAGNWDPNAKQPWSYRLQKWILKNPFLTRNMQVLVYGYWPDQTGNIKPFFTASFPEAEIKEVKRKAFDAPFTFLFVGNLVPGKRPIEAIQLVHGLKESGSRVNLEIYGHGPERDNLESYCRENNLQGDVKFHGNRSLEELKAAYQNAHFVILPSRSEGWPKALAEGMFFGCIPIATPVSCVPWMLGEGSRGVLITNKANGQRPTANGSKKGSVDSGQWAVDIEKILCLLRKPEEMQRMSMEAKRWSQQYTLERFEEGIKEVLSVRGLNKSAETGKLSPAPFRDGVKRRKN